MRYFGFIKSDFIENSSNTNIADFLIQNKLFQEAIPRKFYSFDDFDFCEIENEKTIIKSTQLFSLTVHEFTKLILSNLRDQFKTKLNQKLNIEIPINLDFRTLLIDDEIYFELEPTQNLLDDFYNFIINHFEFKISSFKTSMCMDLNEKLFGLNYKKQHRIALNHYKEIYNCLFEDKIIYVPDNEEDSEFQNNILSIDFLKIENKLKLVFYNKIKYQYKLATINPFFHYLTGNSSILDKNFYLKNKLILDQVLRYESIKEIMVELNKKYEFEDDFYFANQKEPKKSIENTDKNNYSKNLTIPFHQFIRHNNKIEIEKIIKTHYSDLKGVSLRHLIEYLKEEGLILLNYGDVTKLYNSLETLFEGKDIGAYTSIFDKKVFKSNDPNYLNAKIVFTKHFKEIL